MAGNRLGGSRADEETIVAPATGPGRAPLALVRMSGTRALEAARAVFEPMRGGWPIAPRRAVFGELHDREGRTIDRGLALYFPAPRSATGEDLVELSCHGAPPVVREIVAGAVAAGARHAEPGEFTLRGLRNGKLDLTQAEGVADLVAAESVAQARIASRQLAGEVSETLLPLAERTADLLADVEAGLDFSEEEQDLALGGGLIAESCRGLISEIDRIARASEVARRVREGARVVLRGPVNAGKSSVFNMLLNSPRAIVTGEPGTTRDLIEETIVIRGLPVVLCDAAGLRESDSAAEREGVERARRAAGGADLVLEVYDASQGARPDREPLSGGPPSILVATHIDLPIPRPPSPDSIGVDALRGVGREALIEAISDRLGAPGNGAIESVALATERHRAAMKRAREALIEGAEVATGGDAELVAVHLRDAVAEMRGLLGAIGPEELLGRIFTRFCIGK